MRWGAAIFVALLALASVPPAEAARKALVIGNAAYKARPLANPVNDATDMAKRLEGLGFAVTTATDATRRQMAAAILAFHRSLAAGDEAVVFYAGHGLQVRGQNWLLPVDVDPQSEEEVEYDAIALDSILRGLAAAGARASLVLLDACRDNPFEQRFRGGTRGLARVEAAASGTLVSYAARPGTVAADGQGRNSPYTTAWLAALAEPGLKHHQILDHVHVAVKRATDNRQETWQEGQMIGAMVLNTASPAPGAAPLPAFDPHLAELRFWESVERGGAAADYEAYLAQYPQGRFVALAKARLVALRPAPAPPAPIEVDPRDTEMVAAATANVRSAPATTAARLATLAAGTRVTVTGKAKGSDWLRIERPGGGEGWVFAPLLADVPLVALPVASAPTPSPLPAAVAPVPSAPGTDISPGTKFRDCSACPEMVWLPRGTFTMGSPADEAGRRSDENPQRTVRIGHDLAVAVNEVTRGEFAAFVEATGYSAGDRCGILTDGKWELTTGHGWRDPGYFQDDRHPVVCVDWYAANAYVSWLSRRTGRHYRLLSEAEWEYAARAGTATRYWWGASPHVGCEMANVADQSMKDSYPKIPWAVVCRDGYAHTAPVGTYPANDFGLHDVAGNVVEWVEDCVTDSYVGAPSDGSAWTAGECDSRGLRGGSWSDTPPYFRSAARGMFDAGSRYSAVGFRVARTR
ncbi:MAG: SUMF1/EgtB/PvdO family nonheme iron enzyme [Alphaproteobacteria bacterium]